MSTVVRNPLVMRDNAKAAEILAAFRAEWATVREASVVRRKNCQLRHRNRLVQLAGFTYTEAFTAVRNAAAE